MYPFKSYNMDYYSPLPSPNRTKQREIPSNIAVSHTVPRNMSGYEEFFRSKSKNVEGLLDVSVGSSNTWTKCKVVFDTEGSLSTLSISSIAANGLSLEIPTKDIMSISTDVS